MTSIRVFVFQCIFLSSVFSFPQGKEFPIKLQPELDILDVESYLNNPRLLNLQIKCILYDGPCDVVGRWAKPRVKAGLLGDCLLCTEKQKGWLDTWLEKLIKNFPDLYRAGVAKFILNTGIQVPQDEVDKLKSTFARLDRDGLFPETNNSTETEASSSTTSTPSTTSLPANSTSLSSKA